MTVTRGSDNRLLIVGALLCAAFLCVGLVFVFSIRDRNYADSLEFINDAVGQECSAIDQRIDNDFQMLRGISSAFGGIGLGDRMMLQDMLQQINYRNDFVRMGLASLDGSVNLVDIDGSVHEGLNLGNRSFFKQALEGGEAISETTTSIVDGRLVNYYAVPVYEGTEVAAILCAVNTSDVYTNMLTVPVFQGSGFYTILDMAGKVTILSLNSTLALDHGVAFDSAATMTESDARDFRETLTEEKRGIFPVRIESKEHVAVVEPLEVNEWSVIGVVPMSAINGYLDQTAIGATLIIAFAVIIFLFLLYRQRKNMQRNQERLEHIAYTDMLTGLPNYAKFQVDTPRLIQENPEICYVVWSVDIRQFTNINDIFGYDIGNTLLKDFGRALQENIPEGSLCCRVSADNFAGISPCKARGSIKQLFASFSEVVSMYTDIPTEKIHLNVAAGFYRIEDFAERLSAEDMVNRASVAKQAAKTNSGNVSASFTSEMSEIIHRENELVAGEVQALVNGELQFYVQPKVGIDSDEYRISGVEVLARWNHPRFGWVSPAEFIPVFEKTGLITQFDRAIFEQACVWYRRYLDEGFQPLDVAVNVSRLGLLSEDLVPYYSSAINRFDLADSRMELEFTESVILEDFTTFERTVRELQKVGFTCSIDDFGSGYSSLNVLKSLPIDVLKLDAVFFDSEEDIEREETVVEGLISLVKDLGIRTVAEGVEEKSQVEFLKRAGCDIVQGYVFSKPMPPQEFEDLMRRTGGTLTLS